MRTGLTRVVGSFKSSAPVAARELFRARFQRALRNCVRRRFSVAECFGVIWLETLEEISISEEEQSELYGELLHWAKHQLFSEIVRACAPPVSERENQHPLASSAR